jgi:sortase A
VTALTPLVSGPYRWARSRWVASSEADASTAIRTISWTLGAVAALAAWFVIFAMGLSGLQEQHSQHDLYTKFRPQLALETAPIGDAVIKRGAPVALLQSSAGGLDGLTVVEGTEGSQLRGGPGHYPGTPLPGQVGQSIVMGRATMYGGPFGRITSFQPGNTIRVTTGQGVFTFVVESVRHAGDLLRVPPPGTSMLTLETSEASGWRSGWAPSRVVFVDAVLHGTPVTGTGGGGTATKADGLMQSDTSGLVFMVLWLQLLLIGVVGVAWASVRWGRWQSWLVGMPVILAALWGATSSVSLLLPNLM